MCFNSGELLDQTWVNHCAGPLLGFPFFVFDITANGYEISNKTSQSRICWKLWLLNSYKLCWKLFGTSCNTKRDCFRLRRLRFVKFCALLSILGHDSTSLKASSYSGQVTNPCFIKFGYSGSELYIAFEYRFGPVQATRNTEKIGVGSGFVGYVRVKLKRTARNLFFTKKHKSTSYAYCGGNTRTICHTNYELKRTFAWFDSRSEYSTRVVISWRGRHVACVIFIVVECFCIVLFRHAGHSLTCSVSKSQFPMCFLQYT